MYATHQPQISAYGRGGAAGFARVCEFALATIKTPLRDASEAMRRGERPGKVFFGSKWRGLDYLTRFADELLEDAERSESDDELLAVFLRIPSIGLAKAGFLAQLLYGRVGCLDMHNLARFGLAPFRSLSDRCSTTRWRLVREYVEVCARCGTPEALWDDWCELVGRREGDRPEAISALHLCCILPERK